MSDLHEHFGAEPALDGDGEHVAWREAMPAKDSPATQTRCRSVPLDLAAATPWLSKLGAALWIERDARRRTSSRAMLGPGGLVLLDHLTLNALAGSAAVAAHTELTSHGPREWLSFRDAANHTVAKLYLLPDTDYLAWDEMLAAMHLEARVEEPAPACPHVALLRNALARIAAPARARVILFEHRRLPWLQTLHARAPLRLSLLGIELARAIASSEGADLSSPQHAI